METGQPQPVSSEHYASVIARIGLSREQLAQLLAICDFYAAAAASLQTEHAALQAQLQELLQQVRGGRARSALQATQNVSPRCTACCFAWCDGRVCRRQRTAGTAPRLLHTASDTRFPRLRPAACGSRTAQR